VRVTGLNRSSYYLEPAANADDLAMMERLDRLHLDHPELGSRKLAVLFSSPGEAANRKRVMRLMLITKSSTDRKGVLRGKMLVLQMGGTLGQLLAELHRRGD
jgi:hypothetical protein